MKLFLILNIKKSIQYIFFKILFYMLFVFENNNNLSTTKIINNNKFISDIIL